MNEYIEYIKNNLEVRTILEQLAEGASELSQASLKVIRACEMNNNFTPVSKEDAINNLKEEYIDINMCLFLLDLCKPNVAFLNNPKWERWAKRLGYKEEE